MLKNTILLLCLLAPVMLMAQDKIAYVNTNEIMTLLPEMKDVQTKLQAKGESLQKSLQAIESEYQTKLEAFNQKLEKFQNKDASVTESEIMTSQKELTQLQERFETHGQSVQAEYQRYQQELITPVHEKVGKAIKDVGDEQHYQYIVDVAALLYTGSSAIDANKFVKAKLGITE